MLLSWPLLSGGQRAGFVMCGPKRATGTGGGGAGVHGQFCTCQAPCLRRQRVAPVPHGLCTQRGSCTGGLGLCVINPWHHLHCASMCCIGCSHDLLVSSPPAHCCGEVRTRSLSLPPGNAASRAAWLRSRHAQIGCRASKQALWQPQTRSSLFNCKGMQT